MGSHDPEALMRLFAKLAARQLKTEHFHRWAGYLRTAREEGFLGSYGPNGEQWRALKTDTILRKMGAHKTSRARKGVLVSGRVKSWGARQAKASRKGETALSPQLPLVDSGQMMKATIGADSKRGWVKLAQSRSIAVSGSDSISTIHQKGLGKGNSPRPHWGIYASGKKRILDEFNDVISDLLKAIGF